VTRLSPPRCSSSFDFGPYLPPFAIVSVFLSDTRVVRGGHFSCPSCPPPVECGRKRPLADRPSPGLVFFVQFTLSHRHLTYPFLPWEGCPGAPVFSMDRSHPLARANRRFSPPACAFAPRSKHHTPLPAAFPPLLF